jgi:hypothetical protein
VLWDVHKVVACRALRGREALALVAHQEGCGAAEGARVHGGRSGRDLHAAQARRANVAQVPRRVRKFVEVREAHVARAAVGTVRRKLGRADDDNLIDAERSRSANQLAKVLLFCDVVQHQDR